MEEAWRYSCTLSPGLDDINRPFTFPSNKFDVVHSRLVGGGINRTRWPNYLRDIKRVLKPGGWRHTHFDNARKRRIGDANKENTRQLLRTLAVFPFTRRLGMSIADVDRLVDRARVEAASPGLKPYFPLYVCIGRKPGA
ncbi:MAG: hypothetical protein LQ342_003058 [Letrouitia transgressa]|nr:MAG: hypothetical protein LQ342_003058 [Letrouitia transgressa]